MKEQPVIIIMIIIGSLLWAQKIPWQLKIVWGYFLCTTALHTFWPYYVPEFAPELSNILGWNSALVLVLLISMPLMILNSSEKFKTRFLDIMKWYMAYDSIVLLTGGNGVFSATTFDATLIACFFLTWNPARIKFDWLGIILSIAAIIHVRGRTGALVVAIMLAIRILQMIKHRFYGRKVLVCASAVMLLIASVGAYFYYPHLIKDVRFEMWDNFFSWWSTRADPWFGTGTGSFEWLGPLVLDPGPSQRGLGYGFYVMHNDWLQLLFETGLVGLSLSIFGFACVAKRLEGKYFATWIGIGVGMLFYYPAHAWIVQVLALILIVRSIEKC